MKTIRMLLLLATITGAVVGSGCYVVPERHERGYAAPPVGHIEGGGYYDRHGYWHEYPRRYP